MEAKVRIFSNPQFGEIRTAKTESGEPLFCLTDLCRVLNLSNPSVVAQRLDEDERPKLDLGRQGLTTFVTEPGMYSVILRSDSPIAKPIQKWVTADVLPSIRKTGGYIMATPDDSPEMIMARALIVAQETINRMNAKLREKDKKLELQAPAVDFVNKVIEIDDMVDIGQAAKLLKLKTGRNRLFKHLRDTGVFFKNRNEPKQEYYERGYFDFREKVIDRKNHPSFVVKKILVTQKGLYWLSKNLNGDFTPRFPNLNIQ